MPVFKVQRDLCPPLSGVLPAEEITRELAKNGADLHDNLLEVCKDQDITLLDLPKHTGGNLLTADMSPFPQRGIEEIQPTPVNEEMINHLNETYSSYYMRSSKWFHQENHLDATSACINAHLIARELTRYRASELAFYEQIDSFTQPEIEQVKQEFDQQRQVLERILGVPDVKGLISSLPQEMQHGFIFDYNAIEAQDRSTYIDPNKRLEQLDELAAGLAFAHDVQCMVNVDPGSPLLEPWET